MQKTREISEYRARLDKTLAYPDLTNLDTLKSLIRKQLWPSSPHETGECNADILDKRTADVSNILDKLRSVSMKDHEASKSCEASNDNWKLKSDYEDCRVMYHEGLQGSPFHTLLVEGYVDGPVEDCLCVSWESSLYKKWWPQTSFPSFKILQNRCLQMVRAGEQICLVRMKVPWPMSDREAVVHYFLFEYFKDGLIIVLINTISDLESIGLSANDCDKNGIPKAVNAVRIDVVGGFALQKVTPERSYFRTIAEMDIKFDLVPPSLINFISRQLIGNGFRLYKKAVASVAKVDEDYNKALADPFYTRIRQAMYSANQEEARQENELNSQECVVLENEIVQQDPKSEGNEQDSKSLPKNESDEECRNEMQHLPLSDVNTIENDPVQRGRSYSEIEEEECEENGYMLDVPEDNNATVKCQINGKRRFCVSPEVEQALGTLERVISMVRKYRPDTRRQSMSSSSFSDGEFPPNMAEDPPDLISSSENSGIVRSGKGPIEGTKTQVLDRASHDSHDGPGMHIIRRTGSSSLARENNHNRIAPSSPEQDLSNSAVTSKTDTPEMAYFSQTPENNMQTRTEPGETNNMSILNGGKNPMLQRKHRVCCFAFKTWH